LEHFQAQGRSGVSDLLDTDARISHSVCCVVKEASMEADLLDLRLLTSE